MTEIISCSRIIITIEITDPETVAAYADIDDALLFDDLRSGSLMQMVSLVSRENDRVERLPTREGGSK